MDGNQILYSATGRLKEECDYAPWSIALYLDDVLVPGSVKAAITWHKDDFETVTGHIFIVIQAGQTLTLRNSSTENLQLLSNVSGGLYLDTSAALDMFLLTTGTTF